MELPMSEGLKAYFGWIHERQEIYYKRFVLKKKAPWTKDPIMQKYKFCNVYREFDRGTEYYMKRVLKRWEQEGPHLLFGSIAYRFVNTIEIFEEFSAIFNLANFKHKAFIEALKAYKEEHGKLFNPAYHIYGTYGKGETLEMMADTLAWTKQHIDEVYLDLEQAPTLEAAWKALQKIPGVGPFIAYEIVCDLMYGPILNRFQENDFVHIGPGAREGLEIIFGKYTVKKCRKNLAAFAHILMLWQDKFLPKRYQGKRLTLRAIEHSLCEFRKYHNIKQNPKTYKRLFTPTEQQEWQIGPGIGRAIFTGQQMAAKYSHSLAKEPVKVLGGLAKYGHVSAIVDPLLMQRAGLSPKAIMGESWFDEQQRQMQRMMSAREVMAEKERQQRQRQMQNPSAAIVDIKFDDLYF